jgi:hypothetical protein
VAGQPRWTDPEQDNKPVTAHGFRSSFRTYVEERLSVPSDLAETCLARGKNDKTLEAYQRGELLAKRRTVMDRWAHYCATRTQDATVTPIRRKAHAIGAKGCSGTTFLGRPESMPPDHGADLQRKPATETTLD